MREKIIVALDVDTREQALKLVEQLKDEVGAFKIGMQLYNSEGPGIVEDIQKIGGNVFIDLKFHDIPNTVAQASKVMTNKGAFMFTIHSAGGSKMMKAAADKTRETAEALGCRKPNVMAVTVLTSISQEEFSGEMGIKKTIADQVVEWAKLAKESGVDGVIASPKEIKVIREACGPDFLIVTPGIRPLWAATNDQSRIMTPKEAVEAGANYLVIGRPITKAENPAEAARKIVAEMEEANI